MRFVATQRTHAHFECLLLIHSFAHSFIGTKSSVVRCLLPCAALLSAASTFSWDSQLTASSAPFTSHL